MAEVNPRRIIRVGTGPHGPIPGTEEPAATEPGAPRGPCPAAIGGRGANRPRRVHGVATWQGVSLLPNCIARFGVEEVDPRRLDRERDPVARLHP